MSALALPLILFLFLFPLACSPGPGNMFFAANGARFGFRATVTANLGYHLATWTVTVAIGLGFMAALDRLPALVRGMKIGGSLYVLQVPHRQRCSPHQHGVRCGAGGGGRLDAAHMRDASQRLSQSSSRPRAARSLIRAAASSVMKNSSSCGGSTEVPASIA